MATAPLGSLTLNRNENADLIYNSATDSYRSVPKDISILSIGGNDYTIRDDEARNSLANITIVEAFTTSEIETIWNSVTPSE